MKSKVQFCLHIQFQFAPVRNRSIREITVVWEEQKEKYTFLNVLEKLDDNTEFYLMIED